MSNGSRGLLRKVLVFSAVVEAGTAIAFIIDPAIVVKLLLGTEVAGVGILLGRCFGIALVALALVCWPGRERSASSRPALRGMLVYNALIAAFLAWLGIAAHMTGIMLWPAAGLHAIVALLLASTYRHEDAGVRP